MFIYDYGKVGGGGRGAHFFCLLPLQSSQTPAIWTENCSSPILVEALALSMSLFGDKVLEAIEDDWSH